MDVEIVYSAVLLHYMHGLDDVLGREAPQFDLHQLEQALDKFRRKVGLVVVVGLPKVDEV